jgi:hypothetical protein
MTNEPNAASSSPPDVKAERPKQTWCFWSTHDSIQNEVPSVTAILETILVVPIYWWIALQIGVILPLLISVAVAPLVLLRSEPSIALGLKWFLQFESLQIPGSLPYDDHPSSQLLVWSLTGLAVAATLSLTWFAIRYISFWPDYAPLTFGLVIAAIPLLYITITGIVGVIGSQLVQRPVGIAMFDVHRPVIRKVRFLFVPCLSMGAAFGVFLIGIFIRIIAIVFHLRSGIISLPGTFRRLVLCTSPAQMPEIVPGLEASNSTLRFSVHLDDFRPDVSIWLARVIFGLIVFPPVWLYRATIKSTAWFWWPLAFLGGDLKRVQNPDLFRWDVMGSLWAKTSIALACLSLLAFAAAHLGSLLFGENELLIPAGRLLLIDWSSLWSWQVFALTASVLSIALVFLVNDVSGRYRIAQETNDGKLLAAAKSGFGWIERLARLRFLVLLAFWGLVGTHAVLYVNSQQCWFSLSPTLHGWAERVYGDRLPRLDKCLRTSPH